MPVLEIQDLTHVFPDGAVAIAEINLKVNAGEFLVIAGPNGSGKTVLALHLNGLLRPTRGKVLLDGEPIDKNIIAARKKVGLVFQDPDNQIVGQTVAEDVAFGPENLNFPPAQVGMIVKESLAAVDLSQFATRSPHALSGGEKRKLAIAGILAMKPKIIVFDEPFTGLDYPGVVQVLKEILRLHKTGHTILLITHELEKVLAHADRLVIMHKGRLVADGKPESVIYRAESYGVRMPLKDGEKVSALTWLK
ncbi:MAG TPA: ATP-binding cassette domain-containing protein [Firmicutes bacterium]|jgi:biotin transport system ATP-binding protein|nr:ATP-binding cassette domain-containing protein [Bacillota bacterium]